MYRRELTFAVLAFILVVPATVFRSFVSLASDAQAGSKVVEQGAASIRQLLQQQVRPLETVPPNKTLPGGGVGIPTLQQQEGEPPLPVVCSEEAGLQKDPETAQCVPIEPPPPSPPRGEDAEQATEEPEEQPDQDDEQSSEDGDSSEGNNYGDSEGGN
jgi:hypothetical protein